MTIRPTQGRIFDLIQDGITSNTAKLIRAQEQTGKVLLQDLALHNGGVVCSKGLLHAFDLAFSFG